MSFLAWPASRPGAPAGSVCVPRRAKNRTTTASAIAANAVQLREPIMLSWPDLRVLNSDQMSWFLRPSRIHEEPAAELQSLRPLPAVWRLQSCPRNRGGARVGEGGRGEQRSGAPLPLGDDQARGPHIPKKRLGDDTADHSERGQDKPDTSTERNTIFAGHSKPSECHRWKITSAAVTGCLLGRGKSGPCRACVWGNAALLRS